jgi:hypothetical protein
MQAVSNDTFGPLIAYIVPGTTVVLGLSPFLPIVQSWLDSSTANAPTISGLLYLTFTSLSVGMTVSAVRWAVVDRLHARLGLHPPELDFARLVGKVEELRLLIEIHYRHYQFYANMMVALLIAYLGYRVHVGLTWPGLPDVAFFILEPVFYVTSRDTLQKYYSRTQQLFSNSVALNSVPFLSAEQT